MTQAPDLVALTVPFPGNVYGAFRMARAMRAAAPGTTLVLGGGWVNTELRSLRDPRVFDYFDYVTLDDGERPLLNLLSRLRGRQAPLVRTYRREGAAVVLHDDPAEHDIPQRATGIPTYEGLPLERYVSVMEMLNPMHRFWSDGRSNSSPSPTAATGRSAPSATSLSITSAATIPGEDLVMQGIRALTRRVRRAFTSSTRPLPRPAEGAGRELLEEELASPGGGISASRRASPPSCAACSPLRLGGRRGGLEVASDQLSSSCTRACGREAARVTPPSRGGHHGSRVSDVRLSHRDGAGDLDALDA